MVANSELPTLNSESFREQALNYQLPTLNYLTTYLDLLVDYLPGKPVSRHMRPVTRLAFNDEFRKAGRGGG